MDEETAGMPTHEWVLQGNYGYGWDDVLVEDTRAEILVQVKCYRENDPETPYRVFRRRVQA